MDEIIAGLGDWRGEILTHVRDLITKAEPDVVEDITWQIPTNPLGVIVWSSDGMICRGETYKDKIKFAFAKGASLEDRDGLVIASLKASVRCAIDIREGDGFNTREFQALIRAAAALNAG